MPRFTILKSSQKNLHLIVTCYKLEPLKSPDRFTCALQHSQAVLKPQSEKNYKGKCYESIIDLFSRKLF